MISAWWLCLIVPVCYMIGYVSCAFMMGSKVGDIDDSDKT